MNDHVRYYASWPWRSVVATLLMLLAGCTGTVRRNQPLLEELQVGEITIEATQVEEAGSARREWFQALLAEQAAAAARRAILERNAAAIVRSPLDGSAEAFRLVGRLSVPIALDKESRGSRAGFQKGYVATATAELLNGLGEIVEAGESRVRWGEVRWTTGSAKTRRARNPDLALLDAAELAMRRALRELFGAIEGDLPTAEPGTSGS